MVNGPGHYEIPALVDYAAVGLCRRLQVCSWAEETFLGRAVASSGRRIQRISAAFPFY